MHISQYTYLIVKLLIWKILQENEYYIKCRKKKFNQLETFALLWRTLKTRSLKGTKGPFYVWKPNLDTFFITILKFSKL